VGPSAGLHKNAVRKSPSARAVSNELGLETCPPLATVRAGEPFRGAPWNPPLLNSWFFSAAAPIERPLSGTSHHVYPRVINFSRGQIFSAPLSERNAELAVPLGPRRYPVGGGAGGDGHPRPPPRLVFFTNVPRSCTRAPPAGPVPPPRHGPPASKTRKIGTANRFVSTSAAGLEKHPRSRSGAWMPAFPLNQLAAPPPEPPFQTFPAPPSKRYRCGFFQRGLRHPSEPRKRGSWVSPRGGVRWFHPPPPPPPFRCGYLLWPDSDPPAAPGLAPHPCF